MMWNEIQKLNPKYFMNLLTVKQIEIWESWAGLFTKFFCGFDKILDFQKNKVVIKCAFLRSYSF